MATDSKSIAILDFSKLTKNESIRRRMEELLGRESSSFLTSVLDLYKSSTDLQECDSQAIMNEVFKAAALKLPINKSLGNAYVIPYKDGKTGKKIPQFQIGWRGMVQLAQRSGTYKNVNADCIYEGQTVRKNYLTGEIEIEGMPDIEDSDHVIGYIGYFELTNGFRKSEYWTKAKVEAHAKRFSKSFSWSGSPWQTNFDAMAKKTVLKSVLRYGPMSIEMAGAFSNDSSPEMAVEEEVAAKANTETVVIDDEMTVETPKKKAAPVPQTNVSDEDCGF